MNGKPQQIPEECWNVTAMDSLPEYGHLVLVKRSKPPKDGRKWERFAWDGEETFTVAYLTFQEMALGAKQPFRWETTDGDTFDVNREQKWCRL